MTKKMSTPADQGIVRRWAAAGMNRSPAWPTSTATAAKKRRSWMLVRRGRVTGAGEGSHARPSTRVLLLPGRFQVAAGAFQPACFLRHHGFMQGPRSVAHLL